MELAIWCLAAFAASAALCAATIRLSARLGIGHDETDGVQKNHVVPTPRLGGVGIFVALLFALLGLAFTTDRLEVEYAFLIVCLLPAFGIGLIEDLTRSAGVTVRLLTTMVSTALGYWLLGAGLDRLDLGPVDGWLAASTTASLLLTLIAAAGIAHAVNIIDGCNGLAGLTCAVAIASLAVVGHLVGDELVFTVGMLTACAIGGFLLLNFPFGRIFLGDGGAYLAGFLAAELAILLVVRNPDVSPWFPLLLLAFPVWETLFSMYRRAVISRHSVGRADALHLHQLLFRRTMRRAMLHHNDARALALLNASTTVHLLPFSIGSAAWALAFWNERTALMLGYVALVLCYMRLYRNVVRFRAPRPLAALVRRAGGSDQAAEQGAGADS